MTNQLVWKLVGVAGLTIAAAGCAASERQRPVSMGPVATGPGTTAAARKFSKAADNISRKPS
ncbi:MAG TPA: hypothetical protein VF239_16665 [Vicinamibacterales bacterium]